MFEKLSLIFKDPDLRKKLFFVLGALVVFRVMAALPIPGVDLEQIRQFFAGNRFFGLLNIFSGGALDNFSIAMLGVGPYITASIIMQLMTMIIPRLKEIAQEEGEIGRGKFNQYSRLLTIPLAIVQGFALLVLLERQGAIPPLVFFDRLINIAIIAAGSIVLMWLGELISEHGIGNGISILIFAGIVSSIPSGIRSVLVTVGRTEFPYIDPTLIPTVLGFIIIGVLVIAGVVIVSEGERPIPVSYAKRVRGMRVYGGVSTHLPLRVNQAGVIPIIFALSVLLFTYFYTAVTFDPDQISSNLQKQGAFVPGIRPGRPTSDFLSKILTRITLLGALFLGFIAVLPVIMQGVTGVAALTIGGTGLLIVVSVVLETIKQVEAQLVMREYE